MVAGKHEHLVVGLPAEMTVIADIHFVSNKFIKTSRLLNPINLLKLLSFESNKFMETSPL